MLFISQWSQFILQHMGNTMVGNNWPKNVHFVTLSNFAKWVAHGWIWGFETYVWIPNVKNMPNFFIIMMLLGGKLVNNFIFRL